MIFDPKRLIYQPARYEICIPGKLDASWLDWVDNLTIEEKFIQEEYLVSTIAGIFDQAGLHGLLRRLYAYGLPIISVRCDLTESENDLNGINK